MKTENKKLSDGVKWYNGLPSYMREAVRERYGLNRRTLKITDELLDECYKDEMLLKPYLRIM